VRTNVISMSYIVIYEGRQFFTCRKLLNHGIISLMEDLTVFHRLVHSLNNGQVFSISLSKVLRYEMDDEKQQFEGQIIH
jgi:hypothetical protein